jgi:hypothetical protein
MYGKQWKNNVKKVLMHYNNKKASPV